jgi:hypothetical protein
VKVVGSLHLVQTLLREKLCHRLDLWVHPIVLGVGNKVFDGGAVPTNLTLLEPPVAAPNGIVYLRYGLAEGIPAMGDMSAPARASSLARAAGGVVTVASVDHVVPLSHEPNQCELVEKVVSQ